MDKLQYLPVSCDDKKKNKQKTKNNYLGDWREHSTQQFSSFFIVCHTEQEIKSSRHTMSFTNDKARLIKGSFPQWPY